MIALMEQTKRHAEMQPVLPTSSDVIRAIVLTLLTNGNLLLIGLNKLKINK